MAKDAAVAGQAQLFPRTIQLPPLSVRAEVAGASANEETREVDLVFTTGAAVRRYDYWSGKEYMETLSLEDGHVRLDRLNQGAPLLDSHNAYSVSDVLGTTVPGSAKLEKKSGTVRVRFSKRDSVGPIWQDVRDGIVRDVSIGYRVHKFEETQGKGDALPIRKAIDWEPFEVSMVPIPADAGAKVRGEHAADANPCEIVTDLVVRDEAEAQMPAEPAKEHTMKEETRTAEPAAPAPQPAATQQPDPIAVERERAAGILQAVRQARLPHDFAERMITEGVALDIARARVLAELERRDPPVPAPSSRPEVQVTRDGAETAREGIVEAILHRVYPTRQLPEQAVQFRGMTLLRMAEAFLAARGFQTSGLSRSDIAGIALGLKTRTGMMTSSDFPLLLADVTGKVLRQAYDEAPQTFTPISRRVNLPDFKETKRLQLGEVSALEEVLEHGEIKVGTLGEGQEKYALKSYAKRYAITRKTLINDDLDAFSRLPLMIGRAVRNLESDTVWALITANAALADGVALFDTATHGNLASVSAVISIDNLAIGRAAMRKQKGLGGTTFLNLQPKYLIVPAAKETIAQQYVTAITANAGSSVNPFAGRLEVIAEPRLDANSANSWYLAADPGQIDIIEYAYLEGENGPRLESRVGFEIEGVEMKVAHDFAAKVIDYRGLWKNTGA